MTSDRCAVVIGALLLTALASPATASADVSPHCQDSNYCLFPGANFTGTKAVASGRGCQPVSRLGFTPARSVARGYGDSYALELYADTSCTTSLGTVSYEVPDTSALAYQLVAIPG
ncbi:MAG TPA: hypothetical protein VJT49_27970 [Amycolatopsis sp.]|uniref:hypothetical protein n=1 Tax=Amycolatopsis sp. TaxID=37632 RepID=UPI002B48D4E8|nr:hypothetical protein [Amycolatopsis sp.]HKS48878.1 hypothetical protein [Amycolatopsis sp.]